MANHAGPPMPPLTRALALPTTSLLPTVANLSAFIASHLPQPPHEREVPLFYHVPRSRHFDANITPVRRLVLSLTPTSGIYPAFGDLVGGGTAIGLMGGCTMAFLHRPWGLERARVPRGSTVLASHKGFDEVLTVGANFALAERLGMDLSDCQQVTEKLDGGDGYSSPGDRDADVGGKVAENGIGKATSWVLKGYKKDPERKIGLVAGLNGGYVRWGEVRGVVEREFGGKKELAGTFGFDNDLTDNDITDGSPANGEALDNDALDDDEGGGVPLDASQHSPATQPGVVRAVAIMNAFHPAEVLRVAQAAVSLSLISSLDDCGGILYLTGAVRDEGLKAAMERGMKVICVGHERCEKWGLKFLEQRVRKVFPACETVIVDEEEVKPPSTKKRKGENGEAADGKSNGKRGSKKEDER